MIKSRGNKHSPCFFHTFVLLAVAGDCQIQQRKPLLHGVERGVHRAALLPIQVADAKCAVVHHVPIPHVHAALIVVAGEDNCLVGSIQQLLVNQAIRRFPSRGLRAARNRQPQPNIRMVRPHQQNALRCQRVKSQRAAADKIPKPVLIQCFQHPVKPLCQRRKLLRRNRPMPREADGNVLSPVLLRRKHVGNMAAGNVGKRLMQRSGRLERRPKPAVADLSLAVQHVFSS